VDPADLDLEEGCVIVRGAPAKRWPATDLLPEGGLEVLEAWNAGTPSTCPGSCHAVEVEVDPETGAVAVTRYVVVYDSGREINPAVVEGQLQGGLVHGIGYGLFEEAIFGSDGGFQTPTLSEYCVAGPADLTFDLRLVSRATAAPGNPEGIKGAGEVGTIPAAAAIAAAVEAAVRLVAPNATISDVPIHPARIVQLIAESGRL
jgi:carbon-monoxide dehydrogenase large subunit